MKKKMTTAINFIIQLIVSFFLGVSYVEPQDKAFLKGSYYQDDIGKVNYLEIADGLIDSSNSTEKCNTGKFSFNNTTGRKKIRDTASNGYLFYATSSDTLESAKSNAVKDDKLGAYIFKVPVGTEIIAPFKCSIVNSSLSTYENMYPDDIKGKSLGAYVQVITEETDKGDQFRITFGSIARHWCCMGKTEPFDYTIKDDKTTPYYKHTFTPDQTYKFDAGDILAEAGQTGVTKSVRTQNTEAYIYIKVEKKVLGGSFVSATISDLYQ